MKTNPVIIIPLYKPQPSDTEIASLRQCFKILNNHTICFVSHKGLSLTEYKDYLSKASIEYFPSIFFSDINGYNRLMLSLDFYKRFRNYTHMLIYQLDAYVFRDELDFWCTQKYDYIGAPVHDFILDNHSPKIPIATLNGGLSLRKVSSAISILKSFNFIYPFKRLIKINYEHSGPIGVLKGLYFFILGNNTHHLLNKYDRNEDYFWAIIAPRVYEKYNVAPVNIALSFSFDNNPELSFELSNKKIPFGCHAFDKNLSFWKNEINIKYA